MAVRAEIYESKHPLGKSFGVSVTLHAILFASFIVVPWIVGSSHGENWGGSDVGGGDAMNATLVSNIPLPANPDAKNVLATESKGVSVSEPKPKVEEPEAIPLPDKNTKMKATKSKTPTNLKPPTEKIPEASNVVPYGQGGPVAGPYGSFSAANTKGGFGFNGGGDFGSRFAWYVDQVRRKVSENWLKYEIDPSVSTARRVYITFDITRSGEPTNIRVEQSSGVPSLDQSATRALQRIDTFGPLPPQYSGNKVSVEFWFDYRR